MRWHSTPHVAKDVPSRAVCIEVVCLATKSTGPGWAHLKGSGLYHRIGFASLLPVWSWRKYL